MDWKGSDFTGEENLRKLPLELYKKRMNAALLSPNVGQTNEERLKKFDYDMLRCEILNEPELSNLKKTALKTGGYQDINNYLQSIFTKENEYQKLPEQKQQKEDELCIFRRRP